MLIGITPGRALCWSPRWDCSDDAVLFDANSGDYWLLSMDGRRVIEWLQAQQNITRDELLARLAELTTEGAALLGDLAAAGLLMGMVDGVATRLPSVFDVDD